MIVDYAEGGSQRYDYTRIFVIEQNTAGPTRYFMFWLPPGFHQGQKIVRTYEAFIKAGEGRRRNGDFSYLVLEPDTYVGYYDTIMLGIRQKGLITFYGMRGLYEFFKTIGYNYRTKRYDREGTIEGTPVPGIPRETGLAT